MPRWTRRELLAAGAGGMVLAHVGGACGGEGPPSPRAEPTTTTSPPMRKGISLIGDLNRYDDSLGVRSYLRAGPRPTTFVSLWARWTDLQPHAPRPLSREGAHAQLADPAGPAAAHLALLDAQIAAAKADGCEVALTLYQAFPAWTRPSVALDPARDPALGGPGYQALGQGGRPHDARIPDDLTPHGPWAWLVAFLCARYARGGAGNPAGAWIDWLAPFNEPNLTWWPQRDRSLPGGTIAGAIAELCRTAAEVAGEIDGAPGLLIPNLSDAVGPASPRGTPWDEVAVEVLDRLRGWRPATRVGWAHHNYADVKHGPEPDGRWRVERLLELQARHGWHERAVWLTEGGYQFAVRRAGWIAPGLERWVVDPGRTVDPKQRDVYAEQVACIQRNWDAMRALPVRVWTQYQVHDRDVRFQSGLRGPISETAAGRVPRDPPYPAYELWPQLAA